MLNPDYNAWVKDKMMVCDLRTVTRVTYYADALCYTCKITHCVVIMINRGGGRKRLPKFEFSQNFP